MMKNNETLGGSIKNKTAKINRDLSKDLQLRFDSQESEE